MLYLLYLLSLLPHTWAQCALASVSSCHPLEDEVILTVALPSPSPAPGLCQQLCGAEEHCRYWSYDSGSSNCSLLHSSYLATCDTITLGPEPDYTQCLAQDSGSCDDLVRENCDLQGSVLWQSDAVRDTRQCQEYLGVLGPVLGGAVFSYSRSGQVCSILDTGARQCRAVSGPRQPSLEQCQASSTTATTRTTPTTATPTTASESPSTTAEATTVSTSTTTTTSTVTTSGSSEDCSLLCAGLDSGTAGDCCGLQYCDCSEGSMVTCPGEEQYCPGVYDACHNMYGSCEAVCCS